MKTKTLFATVLIVVMAFTLVFAGCTPEEEPTTTLESITVDASNAKQDYFLGEQFSAQGLVVKAKLKRSDRQTAEETTLAASDYTVDSSAFNSNVVGSYNIKVSYTYGEKTKSATYKVNVKNIEFDGLDISFKEGLTSTYTLGESVQTVEIDTSKILVREVGIDGIVIDSEISGYSVELFRGEEQVTLTDGKATVGEGAYQIWVSKASDKVAGYMRKAFITVYVVDNVVSLRWNSDAEGTVTTQNAGKDEISSTWKFEVVYGSGNTKQVSSKDVEFATAVDTSKEGEFTVTATYTEQNFIGEQHTTTEATVSYTVTKAQSGDTIVTAVNISELGYPEGATSITENTVLASGITLMATAGKNVSVEKNEKEIDDFKFTRRLKLNGAGGLTFRSVKLEVSAKSEIIIYAQSGSGTEDRTLGLFNDAGSSIGSQTAYGANISKLSYTVESAGTYYIWSLSGGINLYYIAVETESGAESDQPTQQTISVNVSNIDAGNINSETMLCAGVYAMGTESKAIVVEESKKNSADGLMSFTQRLKLGGQGSTSERSIKIVTTGEAVVTVYAITSSSSDLTRTLSLYDSNGNFVEGSTTGGIPNEVTKYEFAIPEGGTFFIWGTNSINLYYISVTQ